MNSIKCVNCGFVSWATAETCKKCGGQLSESDQSDSSVQPTNAGALIDEPVRSAGRSKRVLILLAVVVLMGLCAGLLAFKSAGPNSPKTFVLSDGSKKSSKTWHRSWFSSDPKVEEIVAQYFKVSGWQANPSALTSFKAKGRFEIKNEFGESVVETQGFIRSEVRLRWESIEGEVEFEGQAPDKIVITQKYDDNRVLRRGTNGKVGWSRKGSPDNYSWEVGPRVQLVDKYPMEELRFEKLADLKLGADFINYLQLGNKYDQVFVSGKTMVGDRVAYEVTHRTHPDPIDAMYFDVETGMLLKMVAFRPGAPYIPMFEKYRLPFYESPDLTEIYLEDYRDVNGVKLPFLIRQHFRYYWINTTITDLEANVPIDPSVFEKPTW